MAPNLPPIPLDTTKAAHAVFGRSNFYLTIGDQAKHLFTGLLLNDVSSRKEMSGHSLALFYLVTIFQFIETLPDHLATDALRERIDWKYALHLPLYYLSLEPGRFCSFRQWLKGDQTGQQTLQTLILRMSDITDFNCNQRLGSDANRVIVYVCLISRLGKIWETFNQALRGLATRQPEWLLANSLPHWYERYRFDSRYMNMAVDNPELQTVVQATGEDGFHLLEAISTAGDLHLSDLFEIHKLRQVWYEEFELQNGKVCWNGESCAGCLLPGNPPLPLEKANQDE